MPQLAGKQFSNKLAMALLCLWLAPAVVSVVFGQEKLPQEKSSNDLVSVQPAAATLAGYALQADDAA